MSRVVLYSKEYCSFCKRAKALLQSKNIAFEEVDVTSDAVLQKEIQRLSGRRTVPQIFIDGNSVGGFEELRELDAAGELDRLSRN
ncbi:MAG TPA: glutaredoxin 3 [Candidatus Binatia bacterium]|nr:glutaredoxin 3 [Candidatus Binatia bacterium]